MLISLGTENAGDAVRLMLCCQLALIGNEGFPNRHRTGRTEPSYSDPALVIAKQNNAGELALGILLVGNTKKCEVITAHYELLPSQLAVEPES